MHKNEINVITLGCSKNLVDSQALIRKFGAQGYKVLHDPERVTGEIVIVNTCGFIASAQEESVNMILSLVEAKRQGHIKQLYVMGCLSERFRPELEQEIPEVDQYYGKFDWNKIVDHLGPSFERTNLSDEVLVTPRHYSYLKISEGCNRTCSYCAIPLITGKHKSVPIEDLVHEVERRVDNGCSEFQVIAQDSTYYGLDIYGKHSIPYLMERLAAIDGVKRLRLHYAYPTQFPMELLPVMREHDNICSYLDLALQHSSNHMLRMMRRNITREQTIELLDQIRQEVPNIVLRTTMMVGHPGETEEDFKDLIDFVQTQKFERLGAFAYSHEEGTYARKHYDDIISDEVKQERLETLMDIQSGIAEQFNQSLIGQSLEVIIDREEEDYYVGRTEYDSPEVDPEILISKEGVELTVGNYYQAQMDASQGYDLLAHIVK